MTTLLVQLFFSILDSIKNQKVVLGIKVSVLVLLFAVSLFNGSFEETLRLLGTGMIQNTV